MASTQVPCPDSPWGLEVRWGVLMNGVLGSGHGPASIGLWPRPHFLMTCHGPHPRGQTLGCNDPVTNQVSSP